MLYIRKNILKLLMILSSLIFILSFAFYNGFPVVYQDTGLYIASAEEVWVPNDRPIFYGFFIKFISLNESLWFVIIIQSLITVILIYEFLALLTNNRSTTLFGAFIILVSLTTGLSINVSQLLPDIFAATSIICLFLLIFGNYTFKGKFFFSFLFLLSAIMHLTIIPISLITISLLTTSLVFTNYDFIRKKIMNILLIIVILILSGVALLLSNYFIDNNFVLSKCSTKFIIARMSENGILEKLLNEKCSYESHYSKLCNYRNILPKHHGVFLWDPSSPFNKIGNCSDENIAEFRKIIKDSFRNPHYLSIQIVESIKATIKQFFSIKNEIWKWSIDDPVSINIDKYYHHEFPQYMNSKQEIQQKTNERSYTMNLKFLNYVQYLILTVSLLAILAFFWLTRRNNSYNLQKFYILFFLISLLSNAFITGSLSGVEQRYQNRVIWLIPFLSLGIVPYLFEIKKDSTTRKKTY